VLRRAIGLVATLLLVVTLALPAGASLLRPGDRGPSVLSLQESLAKAGHFTGPTTGYFGDMTRASVISFQRQNGLVADGIVGPATQAALQNALRAIQPSSSAVLKHGDSGPEVQRLQESMARAGRYDGPVTGYFGDLTRAAVVRFQRQHGLLADGIAGEATQRALASVIPVQQVASGVLKPGDSGAAVLSLQQALSRTGHFSGPTTGYFGNLTRESVVAFQRQFGLHADGSAGNDTLYAINSVLATLSGMSAAIAAPPVQPLSPSGYEVVSFYCQYKPEDLISYNALKAYGSGVIDAVAMFMFSVTRDGKVVGQNPEQALQLAQSMGVKSLALVNNAPDGRFDRDVATRVLGVPDVRGQAVRSIVDMLKRHGFYGVNLDFENIAPQDRDNYTQFVRELAAALKGEGLMLTLSVPAKVRDDPALSWSYPFDYVKLGELADRVVIMTYDQHYGGSIPGPVAGVDWVKRVLDYATSCIVSEKILMGVPSYGYDWQIGTSSGRSLPAHRALEQVRTENLRLEWCSVSKVPYYTYFSGGTSRIVYFENAESTRHKIELVKEYRLRGIAIWRLGYEDPGIWDVIRQELKST